MLGNFKSHITAHRESITPFYKVLVRRDAAINFDTIIMDAAWYSLPAFSTNYKFIYKSPHFKVSQTFLIDAFTYEFWMASIGLNLLIIGTGWIFYRFISKSDSMLVVFIGVYVFTGQGWFP